MEKPRPYITAALLCEKVLQEKDETLTLVRIADKLQYEVQGPALPEGAKPLIGLQGLIGIKSGPVVGKHTLKIVGEKPNGERKELHVVPLELLGKDHGQNIILNLVLGIDQDGLHWFDVIFDDELLTRIPLIITPLEGAKSQAKTTT
jgi:hypothetical protein